MQMRQGTLYHLTELWSQIFLTLSALRTPHSPPLSTDMLLHCLLCLFFLHGKRIVLRVFVLRFIGTRWSFSSMRGKGHFSISCDFSFTTHCFKLSAKAEHWISQIFLRKNTECKNKRKSDSFRVIWMNWCLELWDGTAYEFKLQHAC